MDAEQLQALQEVREVFEENKRRQGLEDEAAAKEKERRDGRELALFTHPYFTQCAALAVCPDCGKLAGQVMLLPGPRVVTQACSCATGSDPQWPGYDFNLAAELCRCCGQVLLKSGSKFSVWFCDGCRQQVDLLNGRLGRYAIPIGRHSAMGGLLLHANHPDAPTSAKALEVEKFVALWSHVSSAMDYVELWSGEVVKRVLQERWPSPTSRVPIAAYLGDCRTDEVEKMQRFREMISFLKERGAPDPAPG